MHQLRADSTSASASLTVHKQRHAQPPTVFSSGEQETISSTSQPQKEGIFRRQTAASHPSQGPSTKTADMYKSAGVAGGTKVFPVRIAIGLAAILFLVYLLMGSRMAPTDYYGIMIDAGSTGSRLHVFHFESLDPNSGQMVLKSEVFHALKPGLSSFAEDPRAGAQSLLPLLDLAMSTVPEKSRRVTPINLKATAGLRLLRPEQSQSLLREIEVLLQSYPFLYDPEDAVEIMSGLDEGHFAWVTVNYLLESITLEAPQTCVVLDLGGGSTQIALASPEFRTDLRRSNTMGAEHHMFLYSHLGYGLMAGRGKMFAFEYAEGDPHVTGSQMIESPCIANTDTVLYTYNTNKYRVTGSTRTSADACFERARQVIADPNGSFAHAPQQPQIAKEQPIFAMSYYFDRAQDVGILRSDAEQGSLTIRQYKDVAERVCGLTTAQILQAYPSVTPEDAPYLCTDLSFISALLQYGFGINENATILLARKLLYNGAAIETQWPLGAGLEELFEELAKL
eukprot:m.49480 g.49480  ORF g.49480 m.49480 type:complete len:509 (-) comp12477_c1_seq2:373-1899(-)